MKAPHEMRPGNRYAREPGSGPTLGDLVKAKMALVAVCRRCKHRRTLYKQTAIGALKQSVGRVCYTVVTQHALG